MVIDWIQRFFLRHSCISYRQYLLSRKSPASCSQPLAASRASARHNGPSKLLPTHLEYSLEFDRIISNSDERGDREANGAWTPRGSTWPSIVLLTPNQIPADESQPLPSEFFRPSVKSLVMGVAVWPWNLASHHSSIVCSEEDT